MKGVGDVYSRVVNTIIGRLFLKSRLNKSIKFQHPLQMLFKNKKNLILETAKEPYKMVFYNETYLDLFYNETYG